MNTTQQAYIDGFVKRASEYGFSEQEALDIYKQASPETLAMSPGARSAAQAAGNPARALAPAPGVGVSAASPSMTAKYRLPTPPPAPAINPAHMNDLGAATPPTMDQRITRALGIKASPTETPRMNAGSYAGTLGR